MKKIFTPIFAALIMVVVLIAVGIGKLALISFDLIMKKHKK